MILVGIDIGKLNHTFSIISRDDGNILLEHTDFANNKTGFDFLYEKIKTYKKSDVLIGMEDTGHYHLTLMKYLLVADFSVALINSTVTDLTRKIQGGIPKNDILDSLTICDVIGSTAYLEQLNQLN